MVKLRPIRDFFFLSKLLLHGIVILSPGLSYAQITNTADEDSPHGKPAASVQELSPFTVTGSRVENGPDVLPGVVSVNTQDFQQSGYRDLGDVVAPLSGANLATSGGRGTLSSVFTRGGNSNHTLFLLDGMPIGDPSSANGAFNLSQIGLFGIGRVEFAKGPMSALYGSGAMAGAINLVPEQDIADSADGVFLRTFSEAGSPFSHSIGLEANIRQGKVGYHGGFQDEHSDGDDITPPRLRPSDSSDEKDGYDASTGFGRVSFDINDSLNFSIFGQRYSSLVELDVTPEDPNSIEKQVNTLALAKLDGTFLEGDLRSTLKAGLVRYRRSNINKADDLSPQTSDLRNKGYRTYVSLNNRLEVIPRNSLAFGAEYTEEGFTSKGDSDFGGGFVITEESDAKTDAFALYLEDGIEVFEPFTVLLAGRYDAPSDFEDTFTYRISPVVKWEDSGTTLHAAYGTGFKTPSLHERFGTSRTSFNTVFRGNPDLKAETSEGWEAGFQQNLWEERLMLSVTYFETDYTNAVATVFDANFNASTVNNSDLDVWGVESRISWSPSQAVTLSGDYTYTKSRQSIDGEKVPALRRPKHKLSAMLDFAIRDNLSFHLAALYLAGRRDIDFLDGTPKQLDDVGVVRMAATYDVRKGVKLVARAENLFDKSYESVDGLQAPGREVFIGLHLEF